MEEAMKAYIISQAQTLRMFPIKHDFGSDWVEYHIYYSTEELLRDFLAPKDWRVFMREQDIAHCLDSEVVFYDIKDLFDFVLQESIESI